MNLPRLPENEDDAPEEAPSVSQKRRHRRQCSGCKRWIPSDITRCWYCGRQPWYIENQNVLLLLMMVVILGLVALLYLRQ